MSNKWSPTKIGNLATLRKEKFDPKTEIVKKYIGLEHIEQRIGRINGYGDSSETTSIKSVFEKGDILFGKLRPYLRKYWYAQFRGVCATEILPIVANENVNTKFLFYLLQQDKFIDFLDQKSFGTKMPRTSWNEIKEYECIIPSLLVEQEKIVYILSSVDEVIEKTEVIIRQIEKVKKGLMQQLFTKGIGHTKFKRTEVGEIPEEWNLVKLEDISNVTGGKRLPKGKQLVDYDTGYPYLRVSDMNQNGVSLSDIKYVPRESAPLIDRYRIYKGEIYISVAGTLGLIGQIPDELDGVNLTENADRISAIQCNSKYLLYMLKSDLIQETIRKTQTSNAQPKLALTRIKQFLIPLPNENEQEKIVKILSTVDNKIFNEKRKLNQLHDLKKGLMQSLLTGKVRVKVNEDEVTQA
ncbi:restriction endonuclease subunit S [Bacillus anthracis]|uniref:restriction endonuclease subunit S n=1 Tax=Bacillus tropicus TaxID=2026188 RepID=UPI000BF4368E|nr:restriction endonuclease subunit S [Bacillus anthracis]PGT36878.1 restriction endonuclease subunit S [Bacillus anthracis]PGZ28714.1 restriction endonuclease subunit S [Bacillus anthracis]